MEKHSNQAGKRKTFVFSQVMITKNEEANIERALTWGKGIFDEQIVVDTGSTDRTVALAKKLGARVVHFDWIDDFSAAKNYAIDQASGDWICMLDADEYFEPKEAKRLLPVVRMADAAGFEILETYVVNLSQTNGIINKHLGLRILKREKELRYVGAIHEKLEKTDGVAAKVFYLKDKLCFMHTGYAKDTLKKKNDSGRNYAMIRKQLEKNPEDPGMWGYLGDDYYARGNLEEAEKAYKKAIELYPESIPFEDQRARWTFVSILRLFGERQREEEMYDYFFAAKSVFPQEADFDFIVGRYQFQKNNYEQALEHLTTCISLLEETEQEDSGSYAVANIASVYEALAFSCYYLGEIKAAIRFASVLLSADHESVPGISVFMLCFRDLEGDEKENAAYCLLALRKFEDLKRPEDAAHMSLAAKRTGYTRMQELLEQKIPANVRKTIKNIQE